MTNSHKLDNVGGYRDTAAEIFKSVWIRRLARSRCQIEGQRSSSTEQAEFFGSNRRRRLLAYIMGLEQPLTYEMPYGDPSPGLRRWRYRCANRLGDDSLSVLPAWRASKLRHSVRRYRPSHRLGSWHFPVMQWEFAKRAVNTSEVD